jgi:hypothetical protein
VVEGARLESVYRGNSIEGSNPSLSAMLLKGVMPGSRGWFYANNGEPDRFDSGSANAIPLPVGLLRESKVCFGDRPRDALQV